MSALRLARGFTRRDRVITFAGCYHGTPTRFSRAGPASRRSGPSSPGVPSGVVADTIVCEYNFDGVAAAVASYGEGPRSDLCRAGRGEHGLRAAGAGLSRGVRMLCDASGALLVFDEVITGFRVARGGAQARFGVTPD